MQSDKRIFKIDGISLMCLMLNLMTTTAVLFVPFTVSKIAGHDGWMAPIIACLGGAYLIYIFFYLSNLFPGQTLIEYLPLIVGKVAGKAIGLGYILYFIYLDSSVIREGLALFYGTGVFVFTPEIIVAILLIIASTYGVAAGIEVMGRTMFLSSVTIIIVYTVFILITIPALKMEVFFPVGEAGFMTILKSSILPHTYRSELFLLAMLLPYCRSSREGFVAGNIANLLVAVFIIITIIPCIAILGADTSARSLYAPFFLADFLQPVGIKIFLVSLWVVGFWGKIALLQFCLTDGLSQLLELKEPRAIITPIAIILLVFSLTFYHNATHLFESIPRVFPGAALFFAYLIPTFLCIAALLKPKLLLKSKGQQ